MCKKDLKHFSQRACILLILLTVSFTACEINSDSKKKKPAENDPNITIINKDLAIGSVLETYALWPEEQGNFSVSAELLGIESESIENIAWDFDETDGADYENPDAEGATVSHTYTGHGLNIVTVFVKTTDSKIIKYKTKVPVVKEITLPSAVDGYFTAFDFMPDGRILALAGTAVIIQDPDGKFPNTHIAKVSGADPAFIKLKPDNDTVIIGAGAGGYDTGDSNGCIWQFKLSDFDGTNTIELNADSAVLKLPQHFSIAILNNDTAVINNGKDMTGSASYVSLLNLDSWELKPFFTQTCPSAGVCIDKEGFVYAASTSPSFGTAAGSIRRFTRDQINNSISNNVQLTDAEGELILDTATYTQYSLLTDFQGNLFTSGKYSGNPSPGFVRIDKRPNTDNTKFMVTNYDNKISYIGLGAVSQNHKWMGWSNSSKAIILRIEK